MAETTLYGKNAAAMARHFANDIACVLDVLEHVEHMPDYLVKVTRERLAERLAKFTAAMAEVMPPARTVVRIDGLRRSEGQYEPAGYRQDMIAAGRGHLLGDR